MRPSPKSVMENEFQIKKRLKRNSEITYSYSTLTQFKEAILSGEMQSESCVVKHKKM